METGLSGSAIATSPTPTAAMSCAAPIVEGFVAPMPLRRFLLRYFFLRWRHPHLSSTHERQSSLFSLSPSDGAAAVAGAARHAGRSSDLDIVTAPLSYHVLVYVALNAPPPPPTPQSASAFFSVDDESHCYHHSVSRRGGGGGGGGASQPEMDVLATLTDASRPLSRHCVRRHTVEWSAILRAVGPSGVGFILGYTTFVAQFECGCGSLELFGVSLARAVPEAVTDPRRRQYRGAHDVLKRRSRSEVGGGGPATWNCEPRRALAAGRRRGSTVRQQQHDATRLEPQSPMIPLGNGGNHPLDEQPWHERQMTRSSSNARIRAASEAARVARRSNLSRLPLYDDRCWSDGAACCLSWAKRGSASATMSSTAWEERDVRLRGLVKDVMATRNLFRGYANRRHGVTGPESKKATSPSSSESQESGANAAVGAARRTAALRLLDVLSSSDVVDTLVFPASLSRRPPDQQPLAVHAETAEARVASRDGVRAHLFRVIQTFLLHLMIHTDIRRAALAAQAAESARAGGSLHNAQNEKEGSSRGYGRAEFSDQSNPLEGVVVPACTVVDFLRRVLSSMTWPNPSHNDEGEATAANKRSSTQPPGSFWCRGGLHPTRNSRSCGPVQPLPRLNPLDALLGVLGQWLSFGKRGSFPLHACLHGVAVNQVPWLSSCRVVPHPTTTTHTTTTAAAGVRDSPCDGDTTIGNHYQGSFHRNKRRSEWQQLVWAEFCRFLFSGPIPWLVRTAFHVAWSPKQGNALVYCHRDRWSALVRKEVRAMTRCCAAAKRSRADGEEVGVDSGGQEAGREASCANAVQSVPLNLAPVLLAPGTGKGNSNTVQRGGGGGGGLELSSTLGRDLLYASLRLLPDGRKLRPISTIRIARRKSLENLTVAHASRFARERRWRKRNRRAWARHSTAPPDDRFQLAVRLRRRCRNSFMHATVGRASPDRHRLYSFSACTPPNKTLLRDVLRVLICGQQELQRVIGDPTLASVSLHNHTAEYASWRMFVRTLSQERLRHNDNAVRLRENTTITDGAIGRSSALSLRQPQPFLLHVVRSDASRCFDRLPQTKVLEAVHRLVPHEAYAVLQLDAVMRVAAPVEAMLRRDTAAAATDRAATRRWNTVVHINDFMAGQIPQIPPRWVICEPRSSTTAGLFSSSYKPMSIHPALTVGDCYRRFQTSHVSSWLDWVDGAAVRDVLHEHLQDHLVVLNGRVFRQRSGIIQGSAVSTLLCDQLFCELDQRLCDTLEMYGSPALVLRRVDDVLVAAGSPSNAAAQHCVDVLQRGCTDLGYHCNADKMCCCGSAFVPAACAGADTQEPHATAGGASPNRNATRTIPWCGLLWNIETLEFSIDWRRYVSTSSAGGARAPCPANNRRRREVRGDVTAERKDRKRKPSAPQPQTCSRRVLTEADLYLACLGALRSACLRAPLTVFCSQLNSPKRVLQTLAEMVLIWSDVVVDKLFSVSKYCRPHLRLVLRCVSVAYSVLWKHIMKRDAQLRRSGSRGALVSSARLRVLLWDALRTGLARHIAHAVARLQARSKPPPLVNRPSPRRRADVLLPSSSAANHEPKALSVAVGGWSLKFWYHMVHVCRSRLTMLQSKAQPSTAMEEEMVTILRNAAEAIRAAKSK